MNMIICKDIEKKMIDYSIILGKEIQMSTELIGSQKLFKKSWEDLKQDKYLTKGSTFRYRAFRYFYYNYKKDILRVYPPMPYYQSSQINKYAGGISRCFDSIKDNILEENPFLMEVIKFDFKYLPTSHQNKDLWRISVHQIRIETTSKEAGEPTPEGIHRDGCDYVCIHLIKRKNIKGGVNHIYTNDRAKITSVKLLKNMDSIFLADEKVMHGVGPIFPKDEAKKAYRDVLIVCFTYCPMLEPPTGDCDLDYEHIKKTIRI